MNPQDTEIAIPTLEPWSPPEFTELSVDQTAHRPGGGADGDAFPDCTRS